MAVPAIGRFGVGEIWNDEAELVCSSTSRAAATSPASCLCAFCADRKAGLVGSAFAVVSSRMDSYPVPRSLSSSGEVHYRDFGGMEKKAQEAAVQVRLGDLSLRSMKEDTSCSGSPRDHRPRSLPGDSKRAHRRPRSLVSLCVGQLGRHLEDIHDQVHLVAPAWPAPIKTALLAIARRRGLLSDDLLVALADESWERLDVSASDVTDVSLQRVAEMCPRLQAVDISRCSRLTPLAVRSLVQYCPAVHTLRWGGTSISNATARLALGYILPKLNLDEEVEDSWELLDTKPVGKGVQALRWLVWPDIDSKSSERLEMECPRVVVNPKPFSKGFQLLSVPWEAHPATVLDAPAVEDIDPQTWAVVVSVPRIRSRSLPISSSPELSVAERFKLAFVARDERLAPKRAKNMRQNLRRSEKAWLNSDTEAKSRAWARLLENR